MTETDRARLRQTPGENDERGETARALLEAFCVQEVMSEPIPKSQQRNYSCTITGDVNNRILIGAHFDKTGNGEGVADNWSGVVLNARLLEYFAGNKPHYTLEFVMFGEEEPGMVGARAFLSDRDPAQYLAMVNVDTLGVGKLTIDTRSTNSLECVCLRVADSLGIETRSLNLAASTGDWEAFKRKGVPVLNLHSLDRRSVAMVHTTRDRFGAIDEKRLEEAFQLVLNLVIALDGSGEDTFKR